MALLQVNAVSQYFSAAPALKALSFTLEAGEILGVVGQRGAGKSTLFNLLGGVFPPTCGEIRLDDAPVTFKSVAHAHRLGIAAVHQYPQLADNLDVLTNIFLGRELYDPRWPRIFPQEAEMHHVAQELGDFFDMPPQWLQTRGAALSDEPRQVVALAHALCRSARLLLLDDALAALSFARQQKLLDRLRTLAGEGVAVILSSDDLKHIFAVTDRVLVLYQGNQATLRRTAETTPHEIVEFIVGTNRQERVTPMIWAFENYYAAQQQAEALRQEQQALRQDLAAQGSLNQELVERLHNQVEALDRLNLALQEASRRLLTEREAERKALARELHDQVIQDLLSYNYQLEEVESDLEATPQSRQLVQIRAGLRHIVGDLREMCSDLRPPTIDHHGLSAAIRSLVSQWTEQSGLPVRLELDPELGRLPEAIELSVFRILQEGLSNVWKHAEATQVELSLQRTPDAGLSAQLSDNGRGLPEPVNLATLAERRHFGLVGISERVSLLRGALEVTSAPGKGVTLRIEIPNPYPSR